MSMTWADSNNYADRKPWKLMPEMLLVKRYTLPEMYGSIILPRSHDLDKSHTLFEIVDKGRDCDKIFGLELFPDDIVTVKVGTPVSHPNLLDKHFFLWVKNVLDMKRWR